MSAKRYENKRMMYQYDKELASAFQIDCEDFLNDFEKLQSFNYTDFLKIWKEKVFYLVFAGQNYALLLRDFCENCFWVIKKYIMFPRSMFTQIGAFYLLYGLYYMQPLRDWIKIRLILEEYHQIHELIMEMKNRNQFDAVYIFSKMRADEAFLYVNQRQLLGPEDRFVKGVELFINDTFTASKTQSALIKFEELQQADVFSTLNETNKEYSDLMKKFSDKNPSIPPFQSKFLEEIQEISKNFNKDPPNQTPSEYIKESNTVQEVRIGVKAKALANKNARYRANRNVKTAMDLLSESSDSVDKCEPSTSSQVTCKKKNSGILNEKYEKCSDSDNISD